MRKTTKKPLHYIKKEDLLNSVMTYQAKYKQALADGKPIPLQPNDFGKYILALCYGLSTRYNFNQYTFKDMMVEEAIENSCKAILKFDPTKTDNIFNYFTTIAWRAFQARILKEREEHAIKHKYYQHTYRIAELAGNQSLIDFSNNEHSNRIIDEYEKAKNNKKEKLK